MKDRTEEHKKRRGQDHVGASKEDILKTVYENVSRETFYRPNELGDLLQKLDMSQYLIKSKGIEIYNIPSAFDIETYSFYEGKEKRAIMYIWQLCLGGLCMVGRTWEEFENVFCQLVEELGLHEKKQLYIGVHNLAYAEG